MEAGRIMDAKTPRFLIVARQEFLNGVRSKWFVFATFGLPVFMAAIGAFGLFMATQGDDRPIKLVVIDETKVIASALAAEFPERLPEGALRIQIERAGLNSLVTIPGVIAELDKRVLARDLNGYIHLKKDFLATGQAGLYALTVSNFDLNLRLDMALTSAVRRHRLRQEGLDPERLAELMAPAHLETFRLSETGATPDNLQTFALVYVLVLMLYISVTVYGSAICRAIVEEKVSRISEVMISSIRPFQLLAGKVLGVGSMGLLQIGIWAGTGWIFLNVNQHLLGGAGAAALPFALPEFPPSLMFHFVVWYLLGYFMYALLYAIVGAMVGSEQEAQQVQMPIVTLLIIPLVSQLAIIQNPDSTFAVAMSMIPMFAPIVMFMRIAILTPPPAEIVLSIALCLATIVALLWLAAKIYRIGIMSYGKRPSLRELVRWILTAS